MIQQLATPGVYVEEKNAFNSSVTGIKTAIPAFIGYTEWIHKDGQSFEFQPIRITSINDYHALFGGRYKRPFSILPLDSNDEIGDFTIEGISYKVAPTFSKSYLLYNALRLFYANGGSVCYVVSIGKYKSPSSTDERYCAPELIKAAFSKGISCLKKEEAPTLVVIPEAVMMDEEDCFAVQQELLHHCGSDMKNRFALLDIVNGQLPRNYRSNDIISKFREGIGNNFLAYAACYYPFLDTTIVQQEEYTVDSIYSVDVLLELLLSETKKLLDVKKAEDSILEIYKLTDYAEDRVRLTQTLKVISPIFTKLLTRIRTIENCLPATLPTS